MTPFLKRILHHPPVHLGKNIYIFKKDAALLENGILILAHFLESAREVRAVR